MLRCYFADANSGGYLRCFTVPTEELPEGTEPLCEHPQLKRAESVGITSVHDFLGAYEVSDAVDVAATAAAKESGAVFVDPLDGLSLSVPSVSSAAATVSGEQCAHSVFRFVEPLFKTRLDKDKPFAVQLTPASFATVRRTLGYLCRFFAAPETGDFATDSANALRIDGLLVTLNVLLAHVSLSVSRSSTPAELGFHCGESASASGELNLETASFMEQLNWLMECRPVSTAAKVSADAIYGVISDILSTGMSVFLATPRDRIRVLCSLVERHLQPSSDTPVAEGHDSAAQQQQASLRSLLMARYFEAVSESGSVVSLLSVLDDPQFDHSEDSDLNKLMVAGTTMLLQFAETQVLNVLHGIEDEDAGTPPAYIIHLREFMLKAQSVMLSRAVQLPSTKNPFYGFVVAHTIRFLKSCSELVGFCARVEAWPNTVEITEPNVISAKQSVIKCLQRILGPLLLSLLVFVSNLPLHVEKVAGVLGALRQLIQAVDSLTQGIPEVVASESDSSKASSRWVRMKRKVVVESRHPCPTGVSKHCVRIPGAVSMSLEFHPNSAQTIAQGGTLQMYSDEDCTKEIALTLAASQLTTTVNGSEVWLTLNTGYSNSLWGFQVTAHGSIEIEVAHAPWIVDVLRSASLAAGRIACALSAGSLLADEKATDPEKSSSAWLDCELLGEGLPVSLRSVLEGSELAPLSSVYLASGGALDDADVAPRGVGMLLDVGDMMRLAAAIHSKMAKVQVDVFPVPEEAADVVLDTIRLVFCAIVRHSHATGSLSAFAGRGGDDGEVPPDIAKAWKAAHRLRRALLLAYQAKLLEIRTAREKEAAKKRGASAAPASESKGGEGDAPDAEEADEEPVDKRAIYKELCDRITARCGLLLRLSPVPVPPPVAARSLSRQSSTDSNGPGSTTNLSLEAQTLQAWRLSQETNVPLAQASPDQRFALVVKYVFELINDGAEVAAVEAALTARCKRAALRAIGLSVFRWLVTATSVKSALREIVAQVPTALCGTVSSAEHGIAPSLWYKLSGCGSPLKAAIR